MAPRKVVKIREHLDQLIPLIRDEIAKRDRHLALYDLYDENWLFEALEYLHGLNHPRKHRFASLVAGEANWPSWREVGQLRIICEVVGDLSEYVDRERLTGLSVALELVDTRRKQLFAKT